MLQVDFVLQNGVIGSLGFFFLVLGAIFYVVSINRKSAYPSFPSNLGVTNKQSSLRRQISSLRFLVQGRALLINAYVSQKTYVLPTPKNYYVFISSEKNIKEYASSPIFSLHAAYDDLFAYKYNKLWWDEGEDVNNTQAFYFKILRVGLTTKLPVIYPIMTETMSKVLSDHLERIRPTKDGWRSVQHYPLIAYTTTSVIGPIFFGQKLWSELEFQDAARNYPAQYFALGEMIQHVPTWTVPYAEPIAFDLFVDADRSSLLKAVVTRRGKYRRILIKYLLPLVNEYMNGLESSCKTEDGHSFSNIVQYAVAAGQGKDYWTPKRIVLFVDSLWRSAIHSVPLTLTHAVNSLCEHPEYIQPLREEIENQPITDHNILENLPLLNSFLKETLRIRPLDSGKFDHGRRKDSEH
ncbi:ADP-ribosylation factor protein 3 [Xylographa soralifera]|nr:ADP-ribosylation factor protein 3 [Xylographa soralifera]